MCQIWILSHPFSRTICISMTRIDGISFDVKSPIRRSESFSAVAIVTDYCALLYRVPQKLQSWEQSLSLCDRYSVVQSATTNAYEQQLQSVHLERRRWCLPSVSIISAEMRFREMNERRRARDTLQTIWDSSTSERKVSRDPHLGSSVSRLAWCVSRVIAEEIKETKYLLDHIKVSI